MWMNSLEKGLDLKPWFLYGYGDGNDTHTYYVRQNLGHL